MRLPNKHAERKIADDFVSYFCFFFPGNHHNLHSSEVVVWRCSVEKVFLEISQNSQ